MVQATSDDGGIISYEWYRKPLGSMVEDALDTTDGARITYVPTDDEIYTSEYPYYKYVVDPNTQLGAYKPAQIASNLIGQPIEEEGLFERVSVYEAQATGDYRVVVVNRSGIAKKEIESVHVRIPGPDAESFALEYPEGQKNAYLEGETEGAIELKATSSTQQTGDKVVYIWSNQKTGEAIVRNEDGATKQVNFNGVEDKIKITVPEADRATYDEIFILNTYASRNGDDTPYTTETFRVTDRAHNVSVAPKGILVKLSTDDIVTVGINVNVEVASDEVTYQWYRVTKDETDNDFKIVGATEPNLKITTANSASAATDVFDTDAGSYYCEVTNTVNNSSSTIKSDEISVIPY